MRNCLLIICLFIFLLTKGLHAENYLLNGGQESTIKYKLVQKIEPTSQTLSVSLSFVIPQSFSSATYQQEISDLSVEFTLDPHQTDRLTDERGNQIVKYSWIKPQKSFEATIGFVARNAVSLDKIETSAPFPTKTFTAEYLPYLGSTDQVAAEHSSIKKQSQLLVSGSKTQFDAVQKILSWVIDHMHYVLTPEDYSALYALKTGKGNCQNYSHLTAALLRAAGIPARIVNGVTMKQPFDVRIGSQILTLNMAQGRHSWIEVYFPDLGWMPFDPQQSELFVSNRFVKIEVGVDNNETTNDGLVRWTRTKGSEAMLSFQEIIEADFISDKIDLTGIRQNYGPQKLLLAPEVTAGFSPVKTPMIEAPPVFDPSTLSTLTFDKSFLYGNLEFPEGVDFTFLRESTESEEGQTLELTKNFLVETAEYVTSKYQYGQTFILNTPLNLQKIGLALNKFGGSGQVWVELREDDNGYPGKVAANSTRINLNAITSKLGYYWVDFDFSAQNLVLTPDRYWITLAYSGSPILNWFYSYGKPVGPIDGTRYRSHTEQSWGKSLGFEFNFRIIGRSSS